MAANGPLELRSSPLWFTMQSDVSAWSWSSLNKSGTVHRPMARASPMQTRSCIMKIAALDARVSTSNHQQNETSASQLDALMASARAHDAEISPHHVSQDEGCSGPCRREHAISPHSLYCIV